MQLDDAQKQQVSTWIEEGASLSEVQNRLEQEFGIRLTYMDVRFLVGDLQLTPKDPEPPAAERPEETVADVPAPAAPGALGEDAFPPADEILPPDGAPSGAVKLAVDQITRPGALISGKATFSDGKKADWSLDQFGRLGMVPEVEGYRPPESDVIEFQKALEKELMKLGY
ncbi:MAG: hypothetical protein ACO1QR_12455 [Chthoniobacteraceae bacterium]